MTQRFGATAVVAALYAAATAAAPVPLAPVHDPIPPPEYHRRGETLVQGRVTATWLPSGRVRLRVSSVVLPDGTAFYPDDSEASLALIGVVHVKPMWYRSGGSSAGVWDLRAGDAIRFSVGPEDAPGRFPILGVERVPLPGDRPAVPEPPATAPAEDGASALRVVVPMVFPVLGKVHWSDSFLAPRGGGTRRHMGQDLMAPKMRPILAAFDGAFTGGPGGVTIVGDHGYSVTYYHINNDTPGTDDGNGGRQYAIPAGLEPGDRVVAGQHVAYVGDSGNAEDVGSHLHVELHGGAPFAALNAAPSLRAARRLSAPRVRRAMTEIIPRKGEVRLDGSIRSVDPGRHVIQIDLRCASDGKRLHVPTRPERRWVFLDRVTPRLTGDTLGGQEVSFASLAVGTPVTILAPGRLDGDRLHARALWVERPAFLPPASLVSVLASLMAGHAAPAGRDHP